MVFENFTNLYSLRKTLRFELKPVGRTLENIKENGIIQKDEQRDIDYQTIKKLLDEIHDEFIVASLKKSTIQDWSDFYIFYTEYKKKTRDKKKFSDKEIEDIKKEFNHRMGELREAICTLYTIVANEWKTNSEYIDAKGKSFFKDKGYKILTENGILYLLEHKYKDSQDMLELIGRFKGFFTYFSGFNQNRENYYSYEEKSTAIAYRIVNQNLLTFCNNIQLFEKIQMIGVKEEEKNIFEPNFYNRCLTQEQIDHYNAIIGGEINAQGQRISDGMNQKINEYNQKNKEKLPKLKKLYKQIGAQRAGTVPFILIESDDSLKNILQTIIKESQKWNPEIKKIIDTISMQSCELDKVRISKTSLNIVSNKYFSSWYTIQEKGLEVGIFKKNRKKGAEESISIPQYINLTELKNILDSIPYNDQSAISEDKKTYLFKKHFEEKRGMITNNRDFFLHILKNDFEKLFVQNEEIVDHDKTIGLLGYNQAYSQILGVINTLDKKEHKQIIKDFCDATIAILRFVKLFTIKDESLEQDSIFYDALNDIAQNYHATNYYDAIRNYMTQKPFSAEKIKLNFDKGNLIAGRPDSPEGNTQYCSFIFKESEKFYLGISKNTKLFDEIRYPKAYATDGNFKKMIYKQLDGKTIYGSIYAGRYGAKYSEDKEKYSDIELIERVKAILRDQTRYFPDLQEIIDSEYDQATKLASAISERTLYNLSFRNISKKYLDLSIHLTGEKCLYLFEISSKDFSKKDKTKTNDLQTIYWKNIFSSNTTIKLNGGAEVFFRQASKDTINKNDLGDVSKHLAKRNENAIENKRYTTDKILFHVPITLGFGNKEGAKFNQAKFNQKLNQQLVAHCDDIKIIGIDRGEKHLAFYSVVDMQGTIVEQGTLNTVGGINYEEKLSEKAATRLEARQNRDTIGNIKHLKEGYISQVVRKIADLVLKHNAVVVFEDLNTGFKRGRQKIEQSVYQKLELALAKKFNFLVNKGTALGQAGSPTNAYQLTPPINTFGDIKGKQRGVIFYTRANYTSQTDPVTGFRKNLYLKRTSREDMKRQIESFDGIGFDASKGAYFFSYNPTKFTEGKGQNSWTVWSCVDRFRGSKNTSSGQWVIKPISITDELDILFAQNTIEKNAHILEQIKKSSSLSAEFYSSLIWLFDVTMQIRNTGNDAFDLDFIQSPVEPFFDSRQYKVVNPDETENAIEKPTSGDANGAYNIARKGIVMLQRIKNKPDKPDLYISDDDWDMFVVS